MSTNSPDNNLEGQESTGKPPIMPPPKLLDLMGSDLLQVNGEEAVQPSADQSAPLSLPPRMRPILLPGHPDGDIDDRGDEETAIEPPPKTSLATAPGAEEAVNAAPQSEQKEAADGNSVELDHPAFEIVSVKPAPAAAERVNGPAIDPGAETICDLPPGEELVAVKMAMPLASEHKSATVQLVKPKKSGAKNSVVAGILAAAALLAVIAVFIVIPRSRQRVEPDIVPVAEPVDVPTPVVAEPVVPMTPRVSPPTAPAEAEPPPADFYSLGDAIEQLQAQMTDNISAGRDGLKPYLAKATLGLFDARYGISDVDLKTLSDDDAAIFRMYRDLFSSFSRNLGGGNGLEGDRQYIESAHAGLIEQLKELKSPEISRLILCRSVSGFGRYEAFSDTRFTLGSLPLILAYAELSYWKPLYHDGRHVLRLTQALSLRDSSGKEIWKEHPVPVSDVSLTRKNDLFLSQYLRLPRDIEPGRYELVLTVVDQTTGVSASKAAPLTIDPK